jgi:hypothetical protein
MRSLLLASAAIVLATAASAQTIGGRYAVSGTNFDDTPYSGFAEIEAGEGGTCRIRWDTGSVRRGFCLRSGSTFAASYEFDTGTKGLVIYQIAPDGSMSGEWSVSTLPEVRRETLTPVR